MKLLKNTIINFKEKIIMQLQTVRKNQQLCI